jgi:HTH-type transcriptional regulator/antitoxin HigA
MKIKPIRTRKDHREALAEVQRLWGASKGSAEGDKLDVLLTLVDAYEQAQESIDVPDPIEAILFRLEQLEMRRTDLVPILGSRARVSEILNRRRALSLEMIRNLHRELGIDPVALIQPYSSKRRGGRRKAA